MDVLKEVKKAEDAARALDEDYIRRAAAVSASLDADLAKYRSDSEHALDAEIAAYEAGLRAGIDEKKRVVLAEYITGSERLAKTVSKNRDAVLSFLLEASGLGK